MEEMEKKTKSKFFKLYLKINIFFFLSQRFRPKICIWYPKFVFGSKIVLFDYNFKGISTGWIIIIEF
jgi:hypothetical protein